MEVAIGTNGNTPFQREVREWQRIDPNTGALLSGRLEADRWINGPLNTYGKVVDSQNISQPNGTQQSQRKQLELYQARTSSGSMQVIRAQTVQTTSSRWSTSPSSTTISNSFDNNHQRNSVNLKNSSNTGNQISKNLTNGDNNNDDNNMKSIIINNHHYQNSQNHKMLTAPSLKLSNLMKSSNNNCNGGGNNSQSISEKNNLHCINSSMPLIQNNHQHKKTEIQRKYDNNNEITTKPIPTKSLMLQQHQYSNLHDNCNRYEQHLLLHQNQKQLPPTTLDLNRVGGVVVDFDYDDVKEHKNSMINKFTKEEKETDFYLQRGRSVSTDDLTTDWNENNNNADDAKNESSEWRRVSKIRRSFQFPKSSPSPPTKINSTRPIDLPENSVSVSKIRHELENGRRLNTAMRNNNVDLAALDTILNGNSTDIDLSPTSLRKTAFLTSESLKEIRGKLKKLSDESLYKDDFLSNGGIVKMELNNNNHNKQTNNQDVDKTSDIVTKTNSINNNGFENRSRYRDTSSAEWHLRRKSYGFEKMTPPDNKTMYRQETSTDSGIGRSSELGNWSPTESRGTIIAFGEQPKNSTTVVLNGVNGDSGVNLPKNLPIVQRRFRQNSEESSETSEMKRHSIAVDETKYVRDNLRKVFDTKTSIHLNGFYSNDNNLVVDEIGRQRKRVEFCKTEVHFAAESGRVNIVETDGKPPPTNNFRRRRRSSGNTYLDAITSGLQIMHFGDEQKATILEQESESLDDLTTLQNNVTVSVPIVNEMGKKDRNNIKKNMLDEIEQDEISLRGILKNKPIKPKPYHLGENIDTKEKFWGVKLKPVTTSEENDQLFENGSSNNCDLDKPDIAKTDFDRVKFVEERKNGTGYSTKINLSLTDAPFEWNSKVPQSNIMSIELRSPESSANKLPSINCQDTKSTPQIPIAKPRTTVKSSLSPENINLSNQKTLEMNNSYPPQRYQTKTITNEFLPVAKEPLKIVTATNGARKLREHELSYFGVKVNTDDNHHMQRITNTEIKKLKPRSVNNNKNIEIIPNVVTSKWKLSNDKPDLLRHGPVDNITSPVVINLNDQSPDRNITDHIPIYENLQSPSKYNRNKDLDRDEKNLSEMAETADITLKAVTDRHKIQAQKYHQRIEMHSSTPLDTIDEKRSTRTFYDLESEEKFKPTSVLPVASDSFQRKCCSRRSSSASSTGSISDSASINRSHSRSRSREKIDNNNIKKSSLSAVVVRPRTEHRSSSRDSQKSHNNSVENFKLSSPPQKLERKIKRTVITNHSTHNNDKPEPMPRHRREEPKTKSSSNRKESNHQHGEKSSIDKSTLSGRKELKNRRDEKSSSSDRKESIQRHGERLAADRKESRSHHHRERSSNDIVDSSDRLKHSSRSSASRATTSDSNKQFIRSSKDLKDPSNIRSSQRSANNRTENSDSHQIKTRTDSHDRHPSQERHKNSSSTRSSSGKPKVSSSIDQKQRTTVRSSSGNPTNPTVVNSMTKTSSSRHHRSRKDHPRK